MKIPTEDIIKILMEELKTIAKTETVMGQEYKIGDITVIPVSKVSLGVVAGSGLGESRKGADKFPSGGVGGGGSRIVPIAFLVVKGEEISLLNIGKTRVMESLIDTVPVFLENMMEKYYEPEKKESDSE
jgi:uncharacterized spore protein YtfJ